MLDSTLAHRTLGWSNRLQNRDAIEWTAAWYEALAAKADMRAVTLAQIETYQALRSRTGTESRQEIAGAAT